jgi:hypothetical protein
MSAVLQLREIWFVHSWLSVVGEQVGDYYILPTEYCSMYVVVVDKNAQQWGWSMGLFEPRALEAGHAPIPYVGRWDGGEDPSMVAVDERRVLDCRRLTLPPWSGD